jgi:hypothetical protein
VLQSSFGTGRSKYKTSCFITPLEVAQRIIALDDGTEHRHRAESENDGQDFEELSFKPFHGVITEYAVNRMYNLLGIRIPHCGVISISSLRSHSAFPSNPVLIQVSQVIGKSTTQQISSAGVGFDERIWIIPSALLKSRISFVR